LDRSVRQLRTAPRWREDTSPARHDVTRRILARPESVRPHPSVEHRQPARRA
jgi:hypothetical protein